VRDATTDAVVEKLGIERPDADLDGLRAVYAAWCRAVSFDNVLKLIHLAEGRPGPLPGSTAESFFDAWLEHGTGGTCWSGNGALHALLDALGFDVERAIATMLSSPQVTEPNHGSVVATVDGEQWLVDASILGGWPIRIKTPGEPADDGPLPRFAWLDGRPAILWRTASAPDGFHCRIERIGADAAEWDERYQRTAGWSPFNYQLNVRLLEGEASVGVARGRRFRVEPDGSISVEELDPESRVRFLVEVLGIAERVAVRVPDDRPLPPRPD
jgi:N-hydroxyarylamine O-acetyltransferase